MVEFTRPRSGSRRADNLYMYGGDMGELMRRHDWARTDLGDPEQWPQSLCTGVQIMLGSRYPMFIWWSPELLTLYNDPYRVMLGTKHPDALGRPGVEVWPEIWGVVGPLALRVMETGEATYSDRLLLQIRRSGYLEEAYFTFSYSPMPDDNGGIGGVFCAVVEETARVVSERRLATLRELATALHESESGIAAYGAAARALAKNPLDLPFVILYERAEGGAEAQLAAVAGLEEGGPWTPFRVALTSETSVWPFASIRANERGIVVEHLDQREPPPPGGPLAEVAESAIVLPITGPGGVDQAGFMVAGINPRRVFDEGYRGFMDTIVGNLSTGIATARAHEMERERARALVELDRAKSMFFSNASHELRTPLTLMLGPMEALLQQDAPSAGEVHAKVDLAHRNGLRLLRLVNNLLDVSRLEGGRLIANRESTNLAAYTVELVSMFDSAFAQAGLQLVLDCPPLSSPVSIDREMWEKIVLNLVSNALKFTLEGHVSVALRESPGAIELEVQDTGVGIPAEELPHIFERFYRVRTPEARTQEGAGIGLALVQELVKLHGGNVTASSSIEGGTRFTVVIPRTAALNAGRSPGTESVSSSTRPYVEEALRWLPAGDDQSDRGSAVEEGQPVRDAQAPLARILVADDNADMRNYLQQLFTGNYEVRTAANGMEALEISRTWSPSLILADIMMPRLDGFGLLRELRLDPRTRAIPLIFLSARASENTRVDGLRAGANDYMVKPFSTRELIARVEGQVRLAELRTEFGKQEKDARDQLQRLFEQAPAAICVTDGPEHIVRLTNSGFVELAGSDVLGEPLAEALPNLADGAIVAPLDAVYGTAAPFVASAIPVEGKGDENPEPSFYDLVYVPLRGTNGQIDGVFLSAYEVTSQVRARSVAESAVRARDEFLSIAAHELRTPVTGIKGAAQLALRSQQRGTLDSHRLVSTLETIDHAASRLASLIGDLLDVSRLQAGELAVRPRLIDMVPLVRNIIDQAAFGGACEVRLDVPEAPVSVFADDSRLEQIVTNLLENAQKYSPEGGVITVRVRGVTSGITLEVQDQGIGLPPGATDSIFKPFGRAANAANRNIPGMGLGLYVCRRIAELHGGKLSAHSDGEGKGTTMRLWLPPPDASPMTNLSAADE
jgi:signal transduction histidine kinase/CheY-like chemotaxis protein